MMRCASTRGRPRSRASATDSSHGASWEGMTRRTTARTAKPTAKTARPANAPATPPSASVTAHAATLVRVEYEQHGFATDLEGERSNAAEKDKPHKPRGDAPAAELLRSPQAGLVQNENLDLALVKTAPETVTR